VLNLFNIGGFFQVKQVESLMAGNLSFDHLAQLGQKVSWKKFWKFK
jgi:hypothetical protein